jgi:ABC-type sulfate/molybdate transport systems ATPase subunit
VRELLELVRMTHQPLHGWCLPADELVELFGLSARADASPLSLSSGQRQRLSLAAALARPSRLLLLDEPEQSLDVGFRGDLAVLLRDEYAASGGTVVMATHDYDFATTAGARVVELTDGQLADDDFQEEPGQEDAGLEADTTVEDGAGETSS